MADSSVPITAGSGTNVDTRTVTGGDHRQVMVPAGETDAEVAKFTNADPAATDYGLVTRDVQKKVATATLSNVTGSASSVTLLASNAAAKFRAVFNDSTSVLYLKFGATASATSYTIALFTNGYYEFPNPLYTGVVDGIWGAAAGAARCTEA